MGPIYTQLLNLMYTRSRDEKSIDDRNLHTRRFDAPLLKVPNTLSSTSQKAVAYRGATHGNMLPSELWAIATKDVFKNYQKINLKQLIWNLVMTSLLSVSFSLSTFHPIHTHLYCINCTCEQKLYSTQLGEYEKRPWPISPRVNNWNKKNTKKVSQSELNPCLTKCQMLIDLRHPGLH